MWSKWLALTWLVAASLIQDPAPVVRVRSGYVRGRISQHRRAYHYYGIPYATVNSHNRFKAPLPPPSWEGVFDAVEEHVRCPQQMISSLVMGDEDCLRLNVYTPAPTPATPLPVMVFIHGGCFFQGTGAGFLYGGDEFPDYDVVFVSINYRLNIEGFLCLGIEEAPGNSGLKDQIAALKWIKENIRAFGGDPDNVTLFGESAGAVSASLLVQSASARGLFHRVILQSGSSLVPWGVQRDPIATAASLAELFGHHTKDPLKLYEIFSNKTIAELINAIPKRDHKSFVTADTLFVPCIEKEIPGVEPVVTRPPHEIIRAHNHSELPMIIGFNDKEGIYFTYQDFGFGVERIDARELLKDDLVFPSETEMNKTVEEIKDNYFPSGRKLIEGVVDWYSDMHFKVPIILEADLYATSRQPIFYYVFQYSGLLNFAKLTSLWFWSGASHADELFYLLKPHSFPTPWRHIESTMTNNMLTLWTNFAKYSDPTPSVNATTKWHPGCGTLILDSTPTFTTSSLRHYTNFELWRKTYENYRRIPNGFH